MTPEFLRIGHRGAAAYAPENTLSSIQTALECRVDMVELDVRQTKDRQLVLAHDPFLRGTNRTIKLRRKTLAEAKDVCLSGGESIATLDEALEFIKGKAMVNIDLKERGCEEAAVWSVEQLKMEHQVMFSGHHAGSLRKIKQLNPRLYVTLSYPSSFLINLYNWRWLHPVFKQLDRRVLLWPAQQTLRRLMPWRVKRMTVEQGIDALIVRAPFVSPKLVDIVHRRQMHLYTWPADAPQEVAKLKSYGVDGVESNRPDVLHDADSPTLAHP